MTLPIKYEHTRFVHCDEIKNLRAELSNDRSNDNTHYCLVKRNQEKYIRELIRFLILKLYHRDFKTEELANYEDVIVPLDNEVESLWILFLSHTNDYKKFLAMLSSYYNGIYNGDYSNKNTVFFARNFDRNLITEIPEAANEIKNTKKSITRILYKNRYGSLPDFQIKDCFFSDDNDDYWEGSCYPSGRWESGIIVFQNRRVGHFIGTLADQNGIYSFDKGQFYHTDGFVTEYVDGVAVEVGDDESVGEDESVARAIPVASSVP